MNLNPLSLAIVNPRGAGVAAALFEDFTNSAVDFDSSITFTRGSQAMYFDSTGTLKFAPSNMIRNNTMVGAVAGTPGTLPTNWSIGGGGVGTLVQEIVGAGTSAGIEYIDIRLSGTTSTTSIIIFTESATQIAATTAQSWSNSFFLARIAGDNTNITTIEHAVTERTAAGALVLLNTSSDIKSAITSTIARNTLSVALSGGGTVAWVNSGLRLTFSSGVAINITLRIGLPQLQMGSEATPAIRTSGSAVYLPRSNAYQDYNPSTLAPLGFLIEEQRTNLLTYSAEFDNAAWTKSGTCSITSNSTTSPAGTTTADTLTVAALGPNRIEASFTPSTSTTYTFSIFIKAGDVNGVTVRLFFTGGVSVDTYSDYIFSSNTFQNTIGVGIFSSILLQNGWRRLTIICASGNNGVNVSVRVGGLIGTAQTGTTSYIWGAQCEVGAFATSYIATSAAAATRLADSASITGTNFSSWYNQTEGTILANFSRPTPMLNSFVVDISDNTFNEIMALYTDAANMIYNVRDGGISQATATLLAGTGIAGTRYKQALAYKVNDFAACSNGGTVQTSASGTIPTVNRVNIGNFNGASQYLNGHLRSLSYFRSRLPNATIQSVTT
jgi:hypothetical protein